ncbi:MAG: hypothetical protein KDI48_02170 [Xanthomonadales bacterium]|nr:hypothetical protein [Xanthomonadales bacterium]
MDATDQTHARFLANASETTRCAIGVVQVSADLLRPSNLLALTTTAHEVIALRIEESLFASAEERLTLLALESDLRRAITQLEALADNDHHLATLRHLAGSRAEPMPEGA